MFAGALFAGASFSAFDGVAGVAPITYSMTGDVGTFALTGKAADLRATRRFPCAVGSFTQTGRAATLIKLTGYYIICAGGEFVVSGEEAEWDADWLIESPADTDWVPQTPLL